VSAVGDVMARSVWSRGWRASRRCLQFRGPVRGLLASQVLQGSEAKGLVTARCRLPSPAGTSEDAAVEVLEARTRRRRTASRHRPAPEAIKAVLVEEFRRS
jgi:hypothetical protein